MSANGEAAGAAGVPAAEEPAGPTLESLMASFARSGGLRARFREQKHLAMLTMPLTSEGVLYFAPPDRLARYVTRPGTSSLVLHGNVVMLADETGVERMELGESELARHLVENFIVVLRGDLAELRSRYHVVFQVDGEEWRIELVPRARLVRSLIDSIHLEGRGTELRRMLTREREGDLTVTEFHDVEVGRRFTPQELEQFFTIKDPPPRS